MWGCLGWSVGGFISGLKSCCCLAFLVFTGSFDPEFFLVWILRGLWVFVGCVMVCVLFVWRKRGFRGKVDRELWVELGWAKGC